MIVTTYVVASEPYDGWAKIGRTDGAAIGARLPSLQTGNPRRLREIARWHAFDGLEEQMHRHFAAVRGVGEWFALPTSLLAEMAGASHHRRRQDLGQMDYMRVLVNWPVSRILGLAEGDATPAALANQFSALTNSPTTSRLKVLADAS